MEFEHKDFIGVYNDVFSKQWCEDVIEYYQYRDSVHKTYLREPENVNSMRKEDTSSSIAPINIEELRLSEFDMGLVDHFNKVFWGQCYEHYKNNYAIVNTLNKHAVKGYKIQKTLPGQGYHIWHCESDGSYQFNSRVLVYTVYLNDVEEGGETEFLYQSRRIKPKQGTCCIFPAAFTHAHRGNPPLAGEKYLLTGWIEFI